MRALTVQQPWAWAIFHGKPVENRTQLWTHRGPLAIHAGQRWSERGAESELVADAWGRDLGLSVPCHPMRFPELLPMGALIGVVDLVDAHPEAGGCCQPWGESSYVEHGGKTRRVIVHLVLEDPRPLAVPIPCRGARGLWTPPADLLPNLERLAS